MFEDFYEKYETEEHEVFALINKCTGASTNPLTLGRLNIIL